MSLSIYHLSGISRRSALFTPAISREVPPLLSPPPLGSREGSREGTYSSGCAESLASPSSVAAEGLGDPIEAGAAKAAGGAVGEVLTVDETWRPPCLTDLADLTDLTDLTDLGAEASGEGGAAAAAARATAGGEEGGEEGGEPLRAYEQTKRRVPSWCDSAYSHSKQGSSRAPLLARQRAVYPVHAPQAMQAPCTRHPMHTPQVRPRAVALVARLCGAAAAALLRLGAPGRLF